MTKSLIEQQMAMAGMSKDLLKSQSDMIQLKNQLPNEHQNKIDMYGQLSDATGYKQRPNEPWRALLDGMFKGAAMGEKSEMSKKAKENYDILEKGTAFIMDWNKALKEQIDHLNKKEQIKEVAAPYALKLIEGNFSISDPKEKMAYMQEVIDQLAIIDPRYQGIKARSMDQNSALLNYTTADGKFGSVDLVELIGRERYKDISDKYLENMNLKISQQNANSSAMQAQARMMSAETGQNNSRIAQERLQLEQEYAPTNAEAKRAYINNVNFNNDPQQRAQRAALEERGKKNSQYIFELEGKLQTGDIVLSDMEKLKNVIKDASISGSGGWAGIARSLAKGTGNTYSIDQAQMLLQSQLHEMKEIFKGATSDTDVSNFMKTLATLDKNPKASLERLDVLIERAKNKANLYRKQIDLYATDPTSNLFTSTANITQENAISETSSQTNQMAPTQTPPAPAQSGGSVHRVKMVKPDGSIVAVPEDQVTSRLKLGYKTSE